MARKLEVEIVGDASSLHRALGSADKKAEGFGSTLGKVGKMAGLAAGGAALGGLFFTVKAGIGEFAQAQKVTAQTNAVIKSTGNVAHISTKGIQDLAGALMKKSGVDDEAIQSGANLIATFTQIRNEAGKGNDIFNQTTKAALDMSVALGTDVPSAAMQLGKALNDPEKGMTRLMRSGVSFTQAQKDQVKALQDSGHQLEAQKIILGEVNKEFGGSAEAAGKTLPGQLSILRESFNNFAGMLVQRAIPYIKLTIEWLRDHWPEIKAAFAEAWATIKPVLEGIIGLAISVVNVIRDHWSTIGPIVENVKNEIESVFKIVSGILKTVAALLRGDWSEAWKQFQGVIAAALTGIKNMFQAEGRVLIAYGTALGHGIKAAIVAGLSGLGDLAWGIINNIGEAIVRNAGVIAGWGRSIGVSVKGAVVSSLLGIGEGAWNVINNIGQWVTDKADVIKGWGGHVVHLVRDGISDAFGAFKDSVTSLFDWHRVIRWIRDALDFHSPSPHFVAVGEDMVHSIAHGVGKSAGVLKDAVLDLAKGLIPHIGLPGGGGKTPGTPSAGTLVGIGHALQAQGFQVSENSAFGGVHPVHVAGSYHYKDRAIDVNWPGGGPVELMHLREAYQELAPKPHVELMIEDAGSSNQHLHFAMAKGGFGTVRRPTTFLAGERGAEDFAFMPRSKGGLGQPMIVQLVMPDGRVLAENYIDDFRNASRMRSRQGAR